VRAWFERATRTDGWPAFGFIWPRPSCASSSGARARCAVVRHRASPGEAEPANGPFASATTTFTSIAHPVIARPVRLYRERERCPGSATLGPAQPALGARAISRRRRTPTRRRRHNLSPPKIQLGKGPMFFTTGASRFREAVCAMRSAMLKP
jgi:hypothetical protein